MSKRPRVVAITQARISSSRLPGKVLLNVQGKTLLQHHIDRAREATLVDDLVVATTTSAADDPISDLCESLGVSHVRGSEDDVLARYLLAAERSDAELVVRITADCPMIDPHVMDRTIDAFLQRIPDIDYVSNRIERTYPIGLDTEVVSRAVLEVAARESDWGPDREHVTYFVWRQPQRFRLYNVACERNLGDHRWTVDTPEDFELVRHMIDALYPTDPSFGIDECLTVLAQHPEWRALNQSIKHKWPL